MLGLVGVVVQALVVLIVLHWFNRSLFGDRIGITLTTMFLVGVHLLVVFVSVLFTWLFLGNLAWWLLAMHLFIAFKVYVVDGGLLQDLATSAAEAEFHRKRQAAIDTDLASGKVACDPSRPPRFHPGRGSLVETVLDEHRERQGYKINCCYCGTVNELCVPNQQAMLNSACTRCGGWMFGPHNRSQAKWS